MKSQNLSLSLVMIASMALGSISRAVTPVQGTISENISVALSTGSGGFRTVDLSEYDGKILIVMFMTPWCSICQTNTGQVATHVINPLFSTNRGALRGKNDQGIEIATLLISTEPSNFDSFLANFLTGSFHEWALDATTARANARAAFSYYRGAAAVPWPVNDRRRMVILNLVKDSPTHGDRQILANQETIEPPPGTPTNATTLALQAAPVLAAINSVQGPPPTIDFATWRSGFTFPLGLSGAEDDADFDGISNSIEFFSNTHPLIPNPSPVFGIRLEAGREILSYREAKNIRGVSLSYKISNDLSVWRDALDEEITRIDRGSYYETNASFPQDSSGRIFYQLEVAIP